MELDAIRIETECGDDIYITVNGDGTLATICDQDTQRFIHIQLTDNDVDKIAEAIHRVQDLRRTGA